MDRRRLPPLLALLAVALLALAFCPPAPAQWVGASSGWVRADLAGSTSPLTTKGDLSGYSTAPARLAVGANDLCLVADSTQPLGLKWAACSGLSGGTADRLAIWSGAGTLTSHAGLLADDTTGVLTIGAQTDVVPITVRASAAPGTAHILQWQTATNGALGHVAHDGSVTAPAATLGTASTTTGTLSLYNAGSAHATVLQAGNAAAARTYTWPTNFGAAGTVLTDAAGNGTLSWAAAAGGVTNSAGANVMAKSDGTNLVASSVTDDGTTLTLGSAGVTVTEATGAVGLTQQAVGTVPLAITGAASQTASLLTLTGGATPGAGFSPLLNVTGTLPSAGTTALITATTGGSTNFLAETAVKIQMNAGFAGAAGQLRGLWVQNDAVASNALEIVGYGSYGIWGAATTAGSAGVRGTGGAAGVMGYSGGIGVLGVTAGSGAGVVASGSNEVPTAANAALIADNMSRAYSIFLARDNNVTNLSIEDGGYLTGATGGVAGTLKWGVPSGTPQSYTHTLAAEATGTDVAGGSATLASGLGRGNGATSQINLQTPTRGTTGSTAQTLVTREAITSTAIVGVAPYAMQLTADATVQVGQVVMADAGTDGRFDVNTGNGTTAIGVLAPTSNGAAAAGTAYGVVFGGVAYVAQAEDQTVTRAHYLCQSATAGYVADSATLCGAALGIAKALYSEGVTATINPTGCTGGAGCINTALNTPNTGPAGQITAGVDVAALGWAVGDPVVYWNSGGTTPTGLTDGSVYWLVSVSTTNVTISATKGGTVVVPSTQGDDGTQYLARLPLAVVHIQ